MFRHLKARDVAPVEQAFQHQRFNLRVQSDPACFQRVWFVGDKQRHPRLARGLFTHAWRQGRDTVLRSVSACGKPVHFAESGPCVGGSGRPALIPSVALSAQLLPVIIHSSRYVSLNDQRGQARRDHRYSLRECRPLHSPWKDRSRPARVKARRGEIHIRSTKRTRCATIVARDCTGGSLNAANRASPWGFPTVRARTFRSRS